MSKAFLLPFTAGGPILPPTKYDAYLRRHRLEVTISKLKKEKEQLQVDVGVYPVLHIPDFKLSWWAENLVEMYFEDFLDICLNCKIYVDYIFW